MLMSVWPVSLILCQHSDLICLLGPDDGSLLVAVVALAVVLHMHVLKLPNGMLPLPLSAPQFSSDWTGVGVYHRAMARALNVLYLTLVVLGMGLLSVYNIHFIFFASTDSAVMAARREERAQARRDVLTGLRHRRAFSEDQLLGQWSSGLDLGLLMVDIDHFKKVNDTYSHEVGDELLAQVARQLEGAMAVTCS